MSEPEQNERAEWLAWRRQGLGSSDVAAIVGLSPWATPYSVWAEKTGRYVGHDDDDDVKEFGRRAEPMLAPWFEDLTGYRATDWQHRATHPDWPIARATCDALVRRGRAAPLGVLEMKTTGWQRDWEELPDHYHCQTQWQLAVTGLPDGWVFALHGRRPAIYPVRRSDADIAWLLDRAQAFWRDHVEADVAPPVDGHHATTAALAGIARDAAAVDITGHLEDLRAYRAAATEATAAKKHADELANRIKAALGDHEIGTVNDVPAATYAQRRRKAYSVEATTYRALHVIWKDPLA